MTKYMIKASYSPEGIKGVMAKGGSARADAIGKLAAGVGGSVEGVYFSFGSDDLFAIVEAPSQEAMAAIAGTVGQTGALSKYEAVVLLTPAQIDEAAKLTVDYTPPGSCRPAICRAPPVAGRTRFSGPVGGGVRRRRQRQQRPPST